jgi:hypothetical protein
VGVCRRSTIAARLYADQRSQQRASGDFARASAGLSVQAEVLCGVIAASFMPEKDPTATGFPFRFPEGKWSCLPK